MEKAKYLIVIEKANNNYSVFSPDVFGCVATGNTVEMAMVNMKESLEFHLEGMLDNGDLLPITKSLKKHLENEDLIFEENALITNLEVRLPQQVQNN